MGDADMLRDAQTNHRERHESRHDDADQNDRSSIVNDKRVLQKTQTQSYLCNIM